MASHSSPLKDQLTATPEGRMAWNEEQAILDTTEMICEIMRQQQITRSQLAEKLGISKGRVSQMLDGTANITIRTLAKILTVLGYAFRPQCDPLDSHENHPDQSTSESRERNLKRPAPAKRRPA